MSLRLSCIALALCFLFHAPVSAAETLTFQQGVNGYAGAQDLHIAIPEDFVGNGHKASEFASDPENPVWIWDHRETTIDQTFSESVKWGLADNLGLLRFDDIFGYGVDQIPPGAQILSASLTLNRHPDFDGDSADLHRVLIDWDETVRWSSFGPSPGPDRGSDFEADFELSTGPMLGPLVLDVTESLADWSLDPESNEGWIFVPTHTQDVIEVSGSSLGPVTSIKLDLSIQTPQRGEISVWLRHGSDVSVLVNRIGRPDCEAYAGDIANDLNVTIDPDAALDIHFEGAPGSWKPDAFCIDLPLCTQAPPGGLCGEAADGQWALQVSDEYSQLGNEAVLQSWTLYLGDGVSNEVYSSSPNVVIPKRHGDAGIGGGGQGRVSSSEHPSETLRPELQVSFVPALRSSPARLDAMPNSGLHDLWLRIPEGSNDSAAVTVFVTSDDPLVAMAFYNPIVFALGGPTEKLARIWTGSAGATTLRTLNDAGIAEVDIPVSVSASGAIVLSPSDVYGSLGAPAGEVEIAIPLGSNHSSDVNVRLSSSDPLVVDLVGAGGSGLVVNFAPGAPNTQSVGLTLPGGTGSATLTATDLAASLAGDGTSVTVRSDPLVSYDLHIPPYVQLGDAPLGAASDQVVVMWETITRSVGSGDADRFEFQYRRVGDPSWTVAVPTVSPVDSASRLHHAATLTGLDFDESYEYQLVHLRNGSPIPGAFYTAQYDTRTSAAPFRFTAFGNSGQGMGAAQLSVKATLDTLGSDMHVLLGDYVYDFGEIERHGPHMTEVYGDMMDDTLFTHAIGNHDRREPPAYFLSPGNGPPELGDFRNFSFDVGNVHFVSVDTVGMIPSRGDAIYQWLLTDLNASSQTWKVVLAHEVPVTRDPSGVDREAIPVVGEYILRAAVEAGADLFVGGAVHTYQRHLPITAVNPSTFEPEWSGCEHTVGTTLVYAGTGAWTRGEPTTDPLELPLVAWEPELGVGVFDVDGATLRASFVDTEGVTRDEVLLKKCVLPTDCICDSRELFEFALGGNIQLVVGGKTLETVTIFGELPDQIVARLAALITADPDLSAAGVKAWGRANELAVEATIEEFIVNDPGLFGVPQVPSLRGPLLAVLVAMLAASGVLRRRPRVRVGRPS